METRTVQIVLKSNKIWKNLQDSANFFYPKLIFIEGLVECGKIPSELSLQSSKPPLWESLDSMLAFSYFNWHFISRLSLGIYGKVMNDYVSRLLHFISRLSLDIYGNVMNTSQPPLASFTLPRSSFGDPQKYKVAICLVCTLIHYDSNLFYLFPTFNEVKYICDIVSLR